MTDANRVVSVGGHGKVALLAARKLKYANYAIDSIIRNPQQNNEVRNHGVNPIVLVIATASVDELTSAFSGAYAVVFSAAAGGATPPSTHAVDYEAAVRTMAAAEQVGVKPFIMVSYANADTAIHKTDDRKSVV